MDTQQMTAKAEAENKNAALDDAHLSSKSVLEKMQLMCEQSLDPETFDKWESVRHVLESVRSDLK